MRKLAFILILFSFTISAQTYVNEEVVIKTPGLSTQNSQLSFVNQQLNVPASTPQSATNQNAVFISQVGTGNITTAKVVSNDSQISITQDGVNNRSLLFSNSQRIRLNVNQSGISNDFLNYSLGNSVNQDMGINQQGNYNTTISVGANSNAQRLRVNQVGNGSSVYVLHF